jgi:beta-glucanase (GH16 family)
MIDWIMSIWYALRFAFIKESTPWRNKNKDFELVHKFQFATMDLFKFFNPYFSTNNEHRHTWIPKLTCIKKNDTSVTLIGRVNKDEATKEQYPIESGCLNSKGIFSQLYGKFELICKVPKYEGMFWPAWWLYGEEWPPEIDIFEMMAGEFSDDEDTRHFTTTFHWKGLIGEHKQKGRRLRSKQVLSDGYHKYGLLWTPEKMVWYFDDIPIYQLTGMSPDVPMHLVINTACMSNAEEIRDKVGRFDLKELRIYKLK